MAERAPPDLRIVLLNDSHYRGRFTYGLDSLDQYLKKQAGQDVRRKANAVFVLSSEDETARMLGYYTLCAMAIRAMCRRSRARTRHAIRWSARRL
jgi:hypothetical protein